MNREDGLLLLANLDRRADPEPVRVVPDRGKGLDGERADELALVRCPGELCVGRRPHRVRAGWPASRSSSEVDGRGGISTPIAHDPMVAPCPNHSCTPE